MKTIKAIKEHLASRKARSAWDKAVNEYALELLEELEEKHGADHEFFASPADKKELLNGAGTWSQYSWGGCSLIYDADIAKRTCTPSELKKTKNGERRPNASEEWLDVQARALEQASRRICQIARTRE
jgi:hypothetical protein